MRKEFIVSKKSVNLENLDMDRKSELKAKIISLSIAISGIILMWVSTLNLLELEVVNLDFLSPIVFISGIGMQIHWLFTKGYFQ